VTLAFEKLSKRRLDGVHPDLVAVVNDAVDAVDCSVLVVEGRRTLERQKQLVAKGASRTMNSRHLTGHAVDLVAVNGKECMWGKPYHDQIAQAMKDAAEARGVEIDWGGDWRSFKDTPHYQLDWAAYPKQDTGWQSKSGDSQASTHKKLKRTSKKYKLSEAGKVVTGVGVVAGTAKKATEYFQLDTLNATKTYMDSVNGIISTYGFELAVGMLAGGFILFTLLQHWARQDHDEGRYEASGDDEQLNGAGGQWA
jgi:peptidoglycan L-alanyl-D-glutamate endopeptidase CwlK